MLKRCRKLANTMVTMKKLAMVQDPVTPSGPAPIFESAQMDTSQDFSAQVIFCVFSVCILYMYCIFMLRKEIFSGFFLFFFLSAQMDN